MKPNNKVIVYGTGLRAQWFIEENINKCDILFCLDKNRLSGECTGIPVRTWDDVEGSGAERMVIACQEKYTKEIYFRILYLCDRFGLEIYDWRGLDLRKSYSYEYVLPEVKRFLSSDSRSALMEEIDRHDAISFDMFDTLVMRKVLEPIDVFDMVSDTIKDADPVDDFRKKRRENELKVNGVINGIGAVYDSMVSDERISRTKADLLYDLELKCEKEVVIVRESMRDIFRYAVSSGKKVNIISDMYLPHEILENMLENAGISGYDKVYVSCDHGTVKRQELFEIYKNEVKAESYLHIGDNREADGDSARKHGIDAFIIPSALELLQCSCARRLLCFAVGKLNRRIIGEVSAVLFNDPFCLCGKEGLFDVDDPEVFAKCFVSPLLFSYLYDLEGFASENEYDKVILGARDGYIFDRIVKETECIPEKDKYVYMLISRALAFRLGMGNPEVDRDYKRYLKVDERRRLGDEDKYPYPETKRGFQKYLKFLGVDTGKKNLFCDLISGGTVQFCIKHLFEMGLKGYYMGRSFAYMDRILDYKALFSREDIPHDQLFIDRLETLVSAPVPTVLNMDEDGKPVFDEEHRDAEEIRLTKVIQDKAVEQVNGLFKISDLYGEAPDKMLAHALFASLDFVRVSGDLEGMRNWIHLDNNGEETRLFG